MENNETNTTKTENTYAKVGDTFYIEGVEYKVVLVETIPEETSFNSEVKEQRSGKG